MITENLSVLKINKMSQEQYDREKANGSLDENAIYLTPEGENITQDELNEAVNETLRLAKESGEFDGADGQNGKDGADGTSVTITSITESTEEGGSNIVTFSDGKTMTTKNGKDGQDGQDGKDGSDATVTSENIANALGYTPANGSDYLPLSGGTMTGELIVNGKDVTGGSKIVLQNGKGQITASGTQTLFGFTAESTIAAGHSSFILAMRGSGTRPKYNSKDLALYSDIPTVPSKTETWTFTLEDGSTVTKEVYVK